MKVTIIMLSFVFWGCVKVAQDVEAPQIESQLVVFSFLSPEDTWIKVEVSRSKPVYAHTGGLTSGVSNAKVTLTNDGGHSVLLPYNDSLAAYAVKQSLYAIEAGRGYTVKVESDGKIVTGNCTVPAQAVSLTEGVVKSIAKPSAGYEGPYFIYNYKWLDIASTHNYYRVDIEKLQRYVNAGDTITAAQNVCNTVWDDTNRDGALLNGTCEDYNWSGNGEEVAIYLLNTDIHYYEYHRRRLNYFGDDPFSEPFQQYSNITGGLGVIGAYRKTSQTLKIK